MEQPNQATRPVANEDGVVIRPALETLARLQQGTLMDRLSVELNRVVQAVQENSQGKGGSVQLVLKIDKNKRLPNAVYITAAVAGKAPEDPPETDMFFTDDDGNLHIRNPSQRDIFESGPQGV